MDWKPTIYELMILFVVHYLPDGIMGFLRQIGLRLAPSLFTGHDTVAAPTDAANVWAAAPPTNAQGAALLGARRLVMQFGGLRALNDVDLQVAPGAVHGLIGPNGSGKSTMMNVLTGIYVPTDGRIDFDGASLVGKTSPQIAAAGVARTSRNVQLFAELSCVENVLVGLHHSYVARSAASRWAARWRGARSARRGCGR